MQDKLLPRYNDCQYSLFISYAHGDDSANNDWVTSLKTAIFKRMDDLARDIPKLDLHFSGDNGPSAGHLGFELKERLAKSFALLLVVGKKYIDSKWCERELQHFSEVFGSAGGRRRLLIAAMAHDQLVIAQSGTEWKRIVADDQIWVSMYDANKKNKPLPNKMADGTQGFPPAFWDAACQIADRLIEEITKDTKETLRKAEGRSAGPTPWGAPAQQLRVAIGPNTENLTTKAAALRETLEKGGAEVVLLDRALIDNYDPDDPGPLRSSLSSADVLIVPLVDCKPLHPATAGGHAVILANEWGALHKKRSVVWYRPVDVVVTENAAAKHLEYFSQLAPVCTSEQAVANLLFGVGAIRAVRLYVENHPRLPTFRRLARQLESAWSKLQLGPNAPELRCVTLDLKNLATAKQDVAGVVLLLPLKLKDTQALLDQIEEVQKHIPKKGTYPGCVALLFQAPLSEEVPRHEWQHVEIQRQAEEPMLILDADSRAELEEFLLDLWERHNNERLASLAGV